MPSPRTAPLLPLAAALILVPAAVASGATFTGTTSGGSPISFEATGDQVSQVVSAVPVACTGRAGIEPFQPAGTFTANGAESKVSELRPSAVLNRDVTQNLTFTGTIDGSQATGRLAVNYATTDFNVISLTTTVTVCAGSTDFTATTPVQAPPAQTTTTNTNTKRAPVARHGKKAPHKKHRKGKHGHRHGSASGSRGR
jgi:hypothetical protein